MADLEERREYRRAMQLLRRLIQLDPLQESSYRALMRIAAAAGDRSAGLQAYHAAVTNLRHELGVEPDAETRAAYERLLALDPAPPGERPATPSRAAGQGTPRIGSATQPLIGRRDEWASLVDAWRTVADGPSKLVEIRGEAGIGKTRLLEELVRWCRAQGSSAAYTKSYAAEGALAYAPIADWLRSESIRGAIDRLEPIWQSELARVLPELLVDHPGPAAARPDDRELAAQEPVRGDRPGRPLGTRAGAAGPRRRPMDRRRDARVAPLLPARGIVLADPDRGRRPIRRGTRQSPADGAPGRPARARPADRGWTCRP